MDLGIEDKHIARHKHKGFIVDHFKTFSYYTFDLDKTSHQCGIYNNKEYRIAQLKGLALIIKNLDGFDIGEWLNGE